MSERASELCESINELCSAELLVLYAFNFRHELFLSRELHTFFLLLYVFFPASSVHQMGDPMCHVGRWYIWMNDFAISHEEMKLAREKVIIVLLFFFLWVEQQMRAPLISVKGKACKFQ